MGQVIVSPDTDIFLRTANNAAARTALGLGDAATKDTGTTAGTVAAGNDSRITGAVQTTRTVSAGTGLTGGGDLSANRTLAISFGSTAGTACEGNDARLSNSRTPTAHAASHAAAGSDPITITSAQISGSLTQNTTGTASNVTGTVAAANGGTGQTTYSNGQLLIGNASGGLTKATLTGGTNVTITNGNGSITIDATAGAGGVSSFSAGTTGLTPASGTTGAVTLAGTLTEANGGTGETTYANGQLLIGNAAGGLTKATLTAGSNVTITNGDGAITIASTGGGGGGGVEESTFLSSGTWTKPVGAKSIKIYFVSAGATGGPGAKGMIGSSGPLMYGGGGGASGIFSEIELSAENVPSSMGVTIGKPVFNGAIPSFFFSGSYGGAGASVSTALTDSATSQVIYTAQNSLQMQGTLGWLNTPAAATPYQIASVSNPTSNIPSSAGVGISVNAGSSSGSSGNSSASTAVIQNAFLYGGITVSGFSGTNTKNTSAEKQRPMRWTGDIGPSCSSGGASGPSARGDATAPPMAIYNGGDGGGWFDLFTLTNVSTTYGSQNVTCASTAGLSVGMTVSGHPAIRVGNFIATINSATSFSLNTAALATASGVTLTVAAGVGGGGGGGGATTGSTPILVQGINLTSGSTTVTCTSTRGMIPLMAITGDGIPANATIASLTDETTFVLSAAATSTLTGSYAVVNGRGEISGFSISSSNSTSSAISSTLGLTWGQGLMATALTPPLSSNGTFSHVASVSPTAVTISPSATAAGSNQTLYVANAVGFLNGVNVTSGSAVVTVPNSAALQAGMLIDILWPITYSCTAGSGTLTVADTTGIATSSQRIFGPCLKTYSPMVTGFTTNTSITVTSSEVVATGTNIQGYFNRYGGVSTVPSSSGSSYVRIKSVDSLTQITLDAPMLQTHSNVTLMYAVVAGFGGIGAAGGVKIITYK